tara:strand:+ start:3953 stop:4198 length:246 start_codon:yes stop_codon:yes gene_type:complete
VRLGAALYKLGGKMAKYKNITNKEIQRRFDFLANYMTQVGNSLKSLTDMVVHYINFNKNDEKFRDYLNKLVEEAKEEKEEK